MAAACVNGISPSTHGVFTSLSAPPSICPDAPSTIYPTQSMSRTEMAISPATWMSAASLGMNLGSVVITVMPAADCGNSSLARSKLYTSDILGSTNTSIKRLINVDLPVRTGPTTPI